MSQDIDAQIHRDLESLSAESQRGLEDFAEVRALLDHGGAPYRDERPGAEARRDAMARQRHIELALMPLSLERVFVHRVSRAASGGAAALCALAVMVGLSQPALIELVDLMIPGHVTLTLGSIAVVVAVLASYILGGWVAERVFERAMRSGLERSDDPHLDIEALASGPIARARGLARRADGWAVALPLLAAATLVPLLSYLTLASAAFAMRPSHWLADFATVVGSTDDLMLLALGMAVGAALAVAVGRACDREHQSIDRPRLLDVLGHPVILPAAAGALLALLAVLGSSFANLRLGHVISQQARLLLAVGGTLTVVAPATWALLWYRRREQRRLGSS